MVERVKDAAGKEGTTNKFKRVVRKIKIDPHFSYANQLCDVAWARAHGTATFIFPEAVASGVNTRAEELAQQGLPAPFVAQIAQPSGEVCGRCSACPIGADGPPTSFWCGQYRAVVNARDPACSAYVEA